MRRTGLSAVMFVCWTVAAGACTTLGDDPFGDAAALDGAVVDAAVVDAAADGGVDATIDAGFDATSDAATFGAER